MNACANPERPWEPMGMCTADWLHIKPKRVLIDSIIPTQAQLSFDALAAHKPTSFSGDEFSHCVFWEGKLCLNDGHHRLIRALMEHAVTLEVRIAFPFVHFFPRSQEKVYGK